MAQKETEQLNLILNGAAITRALCSIAELGVADHIQLGEPQPVAHLAKATGAHERSLYRVLRFLAGHGLFEEKQPGYFDHTPLSHCLRSDVEGSYRAAGRMFHRLFPGWEGLHHSLLTGEPGAQSVFKKPIFQFVGEHPDLGPLFDGGMTSIHNPETPAMLAACDFSSVQVLADIGGGNGSLLASVLERYPHMKGILFDLGHVAGRAKENLKGLGDRCSVREGDFFESIPSGADAYLFRHIIHDWTDEQCVQILSHCRKVIPAHGRLLVVECVVPHGNEPSLAKDFDMTMMVFPGGVERTAEEFRGLLGKSGFEMTSITPTTSMVSVVEGRPV
jgi:O-methyltransferase domain